MDSFPLVVNRSHFQTLRRRIVSLYGEDLPQNASESEIFDASFLRYVQRVRELSEPGGESPCFHSMIGSTLWFFHREEYVWSIRHGHLRQVPLQYTCPRLRVAQHAAYWGRENWMSYGGLPYKHLSIGGRPVALSDVAYAARSSTLILAGLCALPWMETNASPMSSLGRRKHDEISPMKTFCWYGFVLVCKGKVKGILLHWIFLSYVDSFHFLKHPARWKNRHLIFGQKKLQNKAQDFLFRNRIFQFSTSRSWLLRGATWSLSLWSWTRRSYKPRGRSIAGTGFPSTTLDTCGVELLWWFRSGETTGGTEKWPNMR